MFQKLIMLMNAAFEVFFYLFVTYRIQICFVFGIAGFVLYLVGSSFHQKAIKAISENGKDRSAEMTSSILQPVGIFIVAVCAVLLGVFGAYEPFMRLFR